MDILERMEQGTAKERVYRELQRRIFVQELVPGQWLHEIELAQELGVSRSPVREALRQLVHEGLAVNVQGKGAFVREFSEEDVEEIFEYRMMLEEFAVERSLLTLTPVIRQQLLVLREKLRESYRRGEVAAYTEWDKQLHDLIIGLSDNTYVERSYERVCSMLQPLRIFALSSKAEWESSIVEHEQLIDAILMGDIRGALEVERTHLTSARNQSVEIVRMQQNKKNLSTYD